MSLERRVAYASFAGVIILFAAVAVGSFTRAYGAGMGCGDEWPTCLGELVPEFYNYAVALEYFHRVFAGIGFILVVYATYLALRSGDVGLRRLALATTVVLTAQVILGAIVVWEVLDPMYSALHNTVAILTMALATGLAVRAGMRTQCASK